MATPAFNSTTIGIQTSESIQTDARSTAELPRRIAPGQSHKVAGLRITAAENAKPARGERLSIKTSVEPEARVTRPKVGLAESHRSTPLEITYPIEISAPTGDRTATLEHPAAVSWKVTNISKKPLGSASTCNRLVNSFMKIVGGDISTDLITFTDDKGNTLPIAQGIGRQIATLGPGKSIEIKGTIGFVANAPPYSIVELDAALELGKLKDPAEAQAIQLRAYSVQLARKYAKDPDAQMLLVVNHRTSKEEIRAWEKLGTEMGTRVNVWNMSLYGGVSLTKAVQNAELGKDFAHKTVVFLNNDLDANGGHAEPIDQLADRDMLRAACENRTSTYIVGGRVDIDVRLKPGAEGPVARHQNTGEFRKDVSHHSAAIDKEEGHDVVKLYARGAPSQEKLNKKAQEAVGVVHAEHPEQRTYFNGTFRPGPQDKSFFAFIKTHELGEVQIDRGLDVNQRAVTHIAQGDIHDINFVTSEKNRYGLYKALPFAQKLTVLDSLVGKSNDKARAVMLKAILADLAEEQQALRQETWNGEVSKAEVTDHLWRLRAVGTHFSGLKKGTARWDLVLDLGAEIEHMADQAKTFWDQVLPARRRATVDSASDDIVDKLVQNAVVKPEQSEARRVLTQRLNALKLRDKNLPEAQRLSMSHYIRPAQVWSNSLTSDYDRWEQSHKAP